MLPLMQLFESNAVLSEGIHMMRNRLMCHVIIGPLKDDTGAVSETKWWLPIIGESVDRLTEDVQTSHDDRTIEHVAQASPQDLAHTTAREI